MLLKYQNIHQESTFSPQSVWYYYIQCLFTILLLSLAPKTKLTCYIIHIDICFALFFSRWNIHVLEVMVYLVGQKMCCWRKSAFIYIHYFFFYLKLLTDHNIFHSSSSMVFLLHLYILKACSVFFKCWKIARIWQHFLQYTKI